MSEVLTLLFFLYIIQGIPYGFQSRFLPIYLRSSSHMSLTSLGVMKLLYIPWLLKPFYTPFMEQRFTKQQCLQLSISGLAVVCFTLANMHSIHMLLLLICLFVFNLMAALQDIAVDGLALSLLTTTAELGKGNVAQVVGYKVGAIIGGGIMLTLSQWIAWWILFVFLGLGYIMSVVLVTFNGRIKTIARKEGEDLLVSHESNSRPNKTIHLSNYIQTLKCILLSRGTPEMLVCVLIYKLGEQGAMNMLPLYMVDKGYAMVDIGFWTGIVGQLASILGSSYAGYLQTKIKDSVKLLYFLCAFRVILIVLITALIWEWPVIPHYHNFVTFYGSVLLMNVCLFISGSITTVTFTLMMLNSQHSVDKIHQITHYTFLATAEVLGKLSFSWVGGVIADQCGYGWSYVVFSVLAIMAFFYIYLFRQHFRFGREVK